jgi:hypothetical protein
VNKAELKRLAVELRREIDLDPMAPFDPYLLAKRYGVDIYPLSGLDCLAQTVRHFQSVHPDVFGGAGSFRQWCRDRRERRSPARAQAIHGSARDGSRRS